MTDWLKLSSDRTFSTKEVAMTQWNDNGGPALGICCILLAKTSSQSCSVSKETIDLTEGCFGLTICSKVPILLNFVRPKYPSGNC